MEGIKFDNKHTYLDYGLILKSKTIGTPEPMTEEIEVPGRNGKLDLTEYLGEVCYKNVAHSFEFEIVQKQANFKELFSRIKNDLHGKNKQVVLDIDPNYYYTGRVKVSEWKSNKKINSIVIDVDAYPFKFKKGLTVYSATIPASGTLTVNLMNLRKTVIPKFTTTAQTTIRFNNASYAFNGTGVFDDIVFVEGANGITFTAPSGTVIKVEYQEAGF